ncbi:hypothetical protein JCM33374_g5650 [Metschnikowia sp. JCM 33374]|nr:hypothetical protein JCM33374_g5650 [Metschnikowia sp. JCM 33374]
MLTEGTSLIVGSHKVEVVRYLSEGGFSKIYEVIMDPTEGDSEVGCLKQVLVPDKAGLNTLRKEVDVMKTLKNARSIVKYYDSNAERLPDGSYQVLVLMELCPNNSLLDYMNERIRSKLSEPEILKILLDISIGVYEMHKIKLIHRDIKIENVLIDAKNSFKLCDFGSVSTPIRPPQHQQEFQLLGHDILYHTTPQYRSPEMIDLYRGFPIDERSDIWALGCFLYKLCYYTTPFEANGDIAILHASFQFPAAPVYSGDLKNLIIIMLQENPVFRPNIVQIIMLVAKLMSTDYKKLDIEDFYGAGEYNFQALYEMQREKHNQLLKQQQYYIAQQKQQQAYELSKQKQAVSTSSSRGSLSNLSRENSAKHLKGSETSVSSVQVEQEFSAAAKSDIPADEEHIKSAKAQNPDLVYAESVSPKNPNSNEVYDETSSESEDLHVDLPELDHIAERYPSLDDIDNTVTEEGADLKRTLSSYKPRSSFDTSGYESSLERVVSRDVSGLQKSDAVKSRTDLESVDAWQKDATPKCDERAEKLADEIFAVGTVGPQRTKSTASAKSSRDSRTGLSVDVSRSSTPKGTSHPEPLSSAGQTNPSSDERKNSDGHPALQVPKSRQDVGCSIVRPDRESGHAYVPEILIGDIPTPNNDFTTVAVDNTYGNLKPDQQIPEPKRGSSNPWGNAIGSPNVEAHKNTVQDLDSDLYNRMANLNFDSHAMPARKTSAEVDLIDLEGIGIPVTSSQKTDHFGKPEIGEIPVPKISRNNIDHSLIDMDFGEKKTSKNEDTKPTFRKRMSEKSTQPLNFQEQVIDFASDDENNSSEMSRVAIRKSLQKSRKSSDNKRSDSNNGEGRKRLSFFGGSLD